MVFTGKSTVCNRQCILLSQYEILYNSLVMKLQSLRCSWCSCSCLSCVRRLRLYFCDAADCGGSSWYSVWCRLFNILSNSWLSASSNSWSKSGKSGGQKPHRLLRLRNASKHWRSVTMVNLLHVGDVYVSRNTTTAQKMVCRPISVKPWCRNTQSVYSDCMLALITWWICSDADRWLVTVTPRIFSTFSRDMTGSGCCGVTAVLHLEFWSTISLLFNAFSLRLFAATHVAMLSFPAARAGVNWWDDKIRVVCKLYQGVARTQWFQVGGCDGERYRSNAQPLNNAGWNARHWWLFPTEHSVVSMFTEKVNYPVCRWRWEVPAPQFLPAEWSAAQYIYLYSPWWQHRHIKNIHANSFKKMYIYKIVTQKDRTCKVMTKLKRLSMSSTSTLVQNDPEQSAGP